MATIYAGPVAIVAAGSEVARSDASGLYQFAAILNLNLAVVNTLPLPALDGGYLALLLVEAAQGGKKVDETFQRVVMNGGFFALLALSMGLVVKDIINLGLF